MRAIIQYDLKTNKSLNFFPSIRNASDYFNIDISCIQKAVSGIFFSSHGYGWRDATAEEYNEYIIKTTKKLTSQNKVTEYYEIEDGE